MAKFNVGDRCITVKDALAPQCIGEEVEIVEVFEKENPFYRVKFEGGIFGYAEEGCLELKK